MLQFVGDIPLEDLAFLEEGVQMNLQIAQEELTFKFGVVATLTKLIHEGMLFVNMIICAQVLCAAASEARMSGSKLPVMSTAGGGNHGIIAFLTNYAVEEK